MYDWECNDPEELLNIIQVTPLIIYVKEEWYRYFNPEGSYTTIGSDLVDMA